MNFCLGLLAVLLGQIFLDDDGEVVYDFGEGRDFVRTPWVGVRHIKAQDAEGGRLVLKGHDQERSNLLRMQIRGDRFERGFMLNVFNDDGLTTMKQLPAVGCLR